jgi:hypothetical protein
MDLTDLLTAPHNGGTELPDHMDIPPSTDPTNLGNIHAHPSASAGKPYFIQ